MFQLNVSQSDWLITYPIYILHSTIYTSLCTHHADLHLIFPVNHLYVYAHSCVGSWDIFSVSGICDNLKRKKNAEERDVNIVAILSLTKEDLLFFFLILYFSLFLYHCSNDIIKSLNSVEHWISLNNFVFCIIPPLTLILV